MKDEIRNVYKIKEKSKYFALNIQYICSFHCFIAAVCSLIVAVTNHMIHLQLETEKRAPTHISQA